MDYLVFSDLHGSTKGLELLKEAIARHKPNVVICLGDILYGAYDGDAVACSKYLSEVGVPVLAVKGNCDYDHDEYALGFPLPDQRSFFHAGHRFRLSHAQEYGIFEAGDVILSGHTHRKTLYQVGDNVYFNPGSIGHPRDGVYSYGLIDGKRLALIDAETGMEISALEL